MAQRGRLLLRVGFSDAVVLVTSSLLGRREGIEAGHAAAVVAPVAVLRRGRPRRSNGRVEKKAMLTTMMVLRNNLAEPHGVVAQGLVLVDGGRRRERRDGIARPAPQLVVQRIRRSERGRPDVRPHFRRRRAVLRGGRLGRDQVQHVSEWHVEESRERRRRRVERFDQPDEVVRGMHARGVFARFGPHVLELKVGAIRAERADGRL
mmetsp:Transcript_14196/g.56591  ORF Transcript_14196/g.56591 Transcript_14196/m.56591 type:complete len:206 (+) Transcript_14196:214-831(+)